MAGVEASDGYRIAASMNRIDFHGGGHMIIGQTRTKRKQKIWSSTMLLACTVIRLTAAHGDALAQVAAAVSPSVQVLYSPEKDTSFARPYVAVDEWRDAPVRHRYIHGGFKGTETRFSFYFPPRDRYLGRFFQHITPIPVNENLAQQGSGAWDPIGFSIESGGYFVETNGGGMSTLAPGSDPAIGGYRANAAAARYSRVVAAERYGPHRTCGYAFGGSGGGYKTIAGFENTDAWDG